MSMEWMKSSSKHEAGEVRGDLATSVTSGLHYVLDGDCEDKED